MTMAEILLQFAKAVGGFLSAGDNLQRARNQEVGALIAEMAECVQSIADQLEQGKEPIAQCHQLLYLSQATPRALRKVASFWNRKSVKLPATALDAAVDAPSAAVLALRSRQTAPRQVFGYGNEPPPPQSTFDEELRKLRETQGLLAAAAALVRSGAGLPVSQSAG